jgi:PadR family transcriptional regulator, regulatory protein PadR
MGGMKLTLGIARVLRAFLDDPVAPRYGVQLTQELGICSGTLYPVLHRLERGGLVASEREQIDPREQERPARRYYRITPAGVQYAQRELAGLADALRPPLEGSEVHGHV